MPLLPLNLGKMRGMQRMSNAAGHFTTVALDQRPPIAQMLAKQLGVAPAEVPFSDMVAAKRILVEELSSQASAMLLDPNYALPAALDRLPARTGLMVTLEDHRFKETSGGRLSHSIMNWSVEKIKRMGGDGVKLLVWYRPDAAPDVLAHQKAYVREVAAECKRCDMAFVLELLTYPLHLPSGEIQKQTPEQGAQHVIDSLLEFAKPHYGVDLFKLESPLPGADLPPPDGTAKHLAVQAWFNEIGRICREADLPWVMLSAGVTPSQFLRVMQFAYGAGANGFLAGRAIWAEALQHYPDLAACREVLRREGLKTLKSLSDLTKEMGHAWTPDYSGLHRIQLEGDMCLSYH
jgi:tagatose 1,6-diphosphate aldolase